MIGRFLSVDPVTAYSNPVGAFNRYDYAGNNPYRFTDPDGRQACGRNTTCALARGDSGGTAVNKTGESSKQAFTRENAAPRLRAAVRAVKRVKDEMEGKTSETKDGSAARFAVYMQPISSKYGVEIGAQIVPAKSDGYKIQGTFVSPYFNTRTNEFGLIDSYVDIHTHPFVRFAGTFYDPFSLDDTATPGYVTIPGTSQLPRVFHYANGVTREVPLK
jgi:hypothetical protein